MGFYMFWILCNRYRLCKFIDCFVFSFAVATAALFVLILILIVNTHIRLVDLWYGNTQEKTQLIRNRQVNCSTIRFHSQLKKKRFLIKKKKSRPKWKTERRRCVSKVDGQGRRIENGRRVVVGGSYRYLVRAARTRRTGRRATIGRRTARTLCHRASRPARTPVSPGARVRWPVRLPPPAPARPGPAWRARPAGARRPGRLRLARRPPWLWGTSRNRRRRKTRPCRTRPTRPLPTLAPDVRYCCWSSWSR